jgi:16S rRNA (uracil1498-N3)-methyltransferase
VTPALRRSAAHVVVDSVDEPHLTDIDRHHLDRVLRLRSGEIVSVTDGRGSWRLCSYVGGGGLTATGAVTVDPPRASPITIGFALPKGDRPEWIVQKLTEVGVDRIVIVDAERSVTRWDGDRAARQVAKLVRVAREASMQSRRVHLPIIEGPLPATAVLSVDATFVAEPGGSPLGCDHRCLVVGPEGGWTDAELAVAAGRVDLGPTILRIETAALVAGARLVAFADEPHA